MARKGRNRRKPSPRKIAEQNGYKSGFEFNTAQLLKEKKLLKQIAKKSTIEEGAKKTLKKSALKGAAKALRFVPGLGLLATAGFGAYGLYDAIKKGYTDPAELLASAAWGSGVEFKDKEEKKKEGIASLKV